MTYQIESALEHIRDEAGLAQIEPSLRAGFGVVQRAHDAIHEFMYLASLCFPNDQDEVHWEGHSAFLLYHWEVFDHAHRSSLEALCSYYNVAFILLRTTLELLLKGAFWQCLSKERFRGDSSILDNSSQGSKLKDWLESMFDSSPGSRTELEQVSAGIFDRLGNVPAHDIGPLPVKIIVQQLDQWGIFSPMEHAAAVVYEGLYSRLSADIHVLPDRIDIGRRIVSDEASLFERTIAPAALQEHALALHRVMDIGILMELNLFQDLVERFDSVRLRLSERMAVMERLWLKYGAMKTRGLL